jgi:hypothetical protein
VKNAAKATLAQKKIMSPVGALGPQIHTTKKQARQPDR